MIINKFKIYERKLIIFPKKLRKQNNNFSLFAIH